MDISKILIKYYLEKDWICDKTYESLEWNDTTMPKPTEEEFLLKYEDFLLDEMREERDTLLRECDHCALPDYPRRDQWLTELELIQTQMTQKPMLRAEVYARALRASQNRKEDSL